MATRRVVVTGLGIVSPVGTGVAHAWAAILAGKSGIARITRFDTSTFPSQIAGEVKDFDVTKWLSGKEARRYDTFIHYGLVAAMEAVREAGLDQYSGDKERTDHCAELVACLMYAECPTVSSDVLGGMGEHRVTGGIANGASNSL